MTLPTVRQVVVQIVNRRGARESAFKYLHCQQQQYSSYWITFRSQKKPTSSCIQSWAVPNLILNCEVFLNTNRIDSGMLPPFFTFFEPKELIWKFMKHSVKIGPKGLQIRNKIGEIRPLCEDAIPNCEKRSTGRAWSQFPMVSSFMMMTKNSFKERSS